MRAAVRTVGVFIDAENLPVRVAQKIFETAECYGRVVERRAYGDFRREALRPWLEIAPRHALSLQIVSSIAPGKNSSDMLLSIDVAEAMCESAIDVFCIASSDSDFTPLASRLRMRGFQAIGLGGRKSAQLLRTSYDEFFELDVEVRPASIPRITAPKVVETARSRDISTYVRSALLGCGKTAADWIDIGQLGSLIHKANPGFDAKEFGSAKLSTVFKNCEALELRRESGSGMQVRVRQKASSRNLTLIHGEAH